MSEEINERSAAVLTVAFFNKDGDPAAPASVTYRIDCLSTKTAIRVATSISPGLTIDIPLTSEDTRIINQSNAYETRLVTVTAVYTSDYSSSDEYEYTVKNLSKVSPPDDVSDPLITTIALATTDSYATVAEADTYLAARRSFASNSNYTSWLQLVATEKAERLRWAALLLDSMRFRGIRSCKAQALCFPRIYHGDDIFPKDNFSRESEALADQYEDWDEVVEVCDDEDFTYPSIPKAVKDVQIELAFQVVHSHLMQLTPMEESEVFAESLSIGGLSLSAKTQTEQGVFNKMRLDAMTIVQLKLRPYLAGSIRGSLI